jgi:hypothetical protein
MKKATFFTIYLHLEKTDLVENGIDRPQWAGISAKWLMDEDGGDYKRKEYKKFSIE